MTTRAKAGKKLYLLVNKHETASWLTREEARRAKQSGDLYLEVTLTKKQRVRLGDIIQELLNDLVTDGREKIND